VTKIVQKASMKNNLKRLQTFQHQNLMSIFY